LAKNFKRFLQVVVFARFFYLAQKKHIDQVCKRRNNATRQNERDKTMEARYLELLKTAGSDRAPTNCTGVFAVGHVTGARDAKHTTVLGLYRAGQVSVALAIRHGAKMGDHLEAVKHGIKFEDLIANGIELRRVKNTESRVQGRAVAQVAKEQAAIEAAKPKTAFVVRKASGQTTVVKTAAVKTVPTATQVAVAVAVVQSERRAKAKKEAEAARKHGVTVTLTAQEQAELLKRNAAKQTQAYTYMPERK
jgi:hypothetical protein